MYKIHNLVAFFVFYFLLVPLVPFSLAGKMMQFKAKNSAIRE